MLIPKVFITRYKPSVKAFGAYVAIKFYATNDQSMNASVAAMARIVGMGSESFRDGVRELVKMKVLRGTAEFHKKANGKRLQLPNVYELLDLQPDKETI